jgi:hypothetical protein
MIRIVSPRSVCETITRRPCREVPNRIDRDSDREWSGSGMVIEWGSPNAVAASSKDTP